VKLLLGLWASDSGDQVISKMEIRSFKNGDQVISKMEIRSFQKWRSGLFKNGDQVISKMEIRSFQKLAKRLSTAWPCVTHGFDPGVTTLMHTSHALYQRGGGPLYVRTGWHMEWRFFKGQT